MSGQKMKQKTGQNEIVPAHRVTAQRVVVSEYVVQRRSRWTAHWPKLLLIPLVLAAAYGVNAFLFPGESPESNIEVPAGAAIATPSAVAEELSAKQSPLQTPMTTSPPDEASPATAALDAAKQRRDERHALNKERAKTMLTRGDRLREQLKIITEEASKWESVVEPLRTNDDGRFIAADPHWIDSFVESYQAERINSAVEDELRDRLDIVMKPVDRAWERADWSNPPDTEISTRLNELEAEVKGAVERARKPRLAIETILQAAKKEGRQADRNLSEAIEFLTAERAAKKAREDQLASDREAAKLEQERMRTVEAEETQKRAEQVRETELLTLIEDRKVRGLLQSFFQPGFLQPDGSISPQKKPVSYSMLNKQRCLEPSQAGLQHLMSFASDRRDDARPRWQGGEAAKLSSDDIERYGMVQMILRDYGLDLVKLGKLSP
jgi:hypothetical protein